VGEATFSQIGDQSDTGILNSEEQSTRQEALTRLLNTAGNYDNFLSSLMEGGGSREQAITDAASNYDPEAATNQLLALAPQLQELASNAASRSLSPYGESAQELAATATRDALRNTASQLGTSGLLNSGAANASLMEAALAPQQQLQTNLASLQSQLTGNSFNNLLGLAGQGLMSGYGQQGEQNLAAAQSNAQNYLSLMGLQSGALSDQTNAYSNLASLTEQQYYTPEYGADPTAKDYAVFIPLIAEAIKTLGQIWS